MGTGPIIISDDGSPPPLRRGEQRVRIGRQKEDMDQLQSANGNHPVDSVSDITGVLITQPGSQPQSFVNVDRVEVRGNLGTSITVEVDVLSSKVVVTTSSDLHKEEATQEFGNRYWADDRTIIEILINDTTTGYDPSIERGHISIDVA
ncbi:MAG TPA: hypothetical protein VEU96_28230 [Bryobacteraceae bacterium]|nr:hypothetical protein [Bryobacteraceae bacterium]